MKWIPALLIICSMVLPFYGSAQKADQAGSKDYPLLNRMPDFFIRNYTEDEFTAHSFTTAQGESKSVEGRRISIRYEIQAGTTKPSYLQIVRNYSNAVEKAGGQVIYEHRNAEMATYYVKTAVDKSIWISLVTAPNLGRRYTLTIVEESLMSQDIVVNADLIKEKIEIEGKVALYGILFDTGKSTIKNESAEALNQIGIYLKNNPNVNCWVVGQTDTEGCFDSNMKLSADRARAVKTYLEQHHAISATRLSAKGVGPLTPLATNDSEEGRKLNRRVELVKKP